MKKLGIACLLSLSLLSCKKQIDELPEPTQTGANTFGAKIDGELWGPLKFGVAQTAPILEANFAGGNNFRINARNFGSSPSESEMEIFLKDVTGPGVYLLNQNTAIQPHASASYAYYVERRFQPTDEWVTNAQYTGKVTITKIDVPGKIIADTFEFNAGHTKNTTQSIQVTEGRFDIKIQ